MPDNINVLSLLRLELSTYAKYVHLAENVPESLVLSQVVKFEKAVCNIPRAMFALLLISVPDEISCQQYPESLP